jgi:hypothetical protein
VLHRDAQHLVELAGQSTLEGEFVPVTDRINRVKQLRPIEVTCAGLKSVAIAELYVPDPPRSGVERLNQRGYLNVQS